MWQVRRGLNILHGATPETLKDLFATTSEVEKMDGMVQTLQIMVGAIEARKARCRCRARSSPCDTLGTCSCRSSSSPEKP